MAQTENLFPAQAKVVSVSVTTSASSAAQLPIAGNTLRVVNESTTGFFFAIADTQAAAVATLPSTGVTTACWAGPGCDYTVSIPNDTAKWVSAITRSGTATGDFYVGEGS
ncbi:hypothetical protein [Paludibacterium sp.]|uniref:hypothetical protein n=1 Tax=Paludibacterium sp. TaxID=1917523 RepID=UPI0025F4791F|nr:hypothetical protein [Paludibacterium sp.]MBV8649695.1 hypothetical protein [Paludibacterium sp.]